jgi:pimeloyl-ACP methyl ester carboxylesterase
MTTPSLTSEVIEFRSDIDGSDQRAGLCGPATPPAGVPLPLIVELIPGSITDLESTLTQGEWYLGKISEPAVWLRPGGRGPGTVFQGYGEVDVFEAIDAAKARYTIDPARISLFGTSMGGAATWYLGSHYPDRFSAIAPICGYNDYRLWTRPDGMTFPLMEWEVPSWRARSAAFILENLRHVGVWMVHGEWDRAVGGGVDVEHSRRSAARLDELGIPYRYTELAEMGHVGMPEPLTEEVLPWLVSQRRPNAPTEVRFHTHDLRHNSAYWVTIEQQQHPGHRTSVEAGAGATTTIRTENVSRLQLRPSRDLDFGENLELDGTRIDGLDVRGSLDLQRSADGSWTVADTGPLSGEKRPGLAGPFGDLFHAETVLVTGTTGSAEETFFNAWCAHDAAGFFKKWNGGVHRGGIPGESWVDLAIVTDEEWASRDIADETRTTNVIAYGTVESNGLIADVADRIPVSVTRDEIRVGDRSFTGDGVALIAVMPHPDRRGGYLAIHGGTSPDATAAGAHLNLQLLPDYLVYDAEHVLEWGFFDNDWSPVPVGGSRLSATDKDQDQ